VPEPSQRYFENVHAAFSEPGSIFIQVRLQGCTARLIQPCMYQELQRFDLKPRVVANLALPEFAGKIASRNNCTADL
jgi:hypothetical protein